ncbi:MAG TPA: LysR substrate-binding domain-containing protein [Rhodanobacteraceae bacterium]
MDLSALSDFHRVAAAGSLGKASRETERPKATLSRHIRQLEESLDVRLVERGRRALRLTAEGQALYERTHDLLREIEDVGQSLSSGRDQPRGLLRVSVPVLFAHMRGGRLAAEFVAHYPDVRVQMEAGDRHVDLVEESFDAVVRVNPSPDSELVGHCFARDEQWVVAPPGLIPPAATNAAAPASVPAVAMTRPINATTWQLQTGEQVCHLRPDYRLVLSSLTAMRDAVVAGAGAAMLPRSLVRNDIAEGKLKLWGALPERRVEVWVLHSSRRLVSPKVAAFVAFLVDSFPARQL